MWSQLMSSVHHRWLMATGLFYLCILIFIMLSIRQGQLYNDWWCIFSHNNDLCNFFHGRPVILIKPCACRCKSGMAENATVIRWADKDQTWRETKVCIVAQMFTCRLSRLPQGCAVRHPSQGGFPLPPGRLSVYKAPLPSVRLERGGEGENTRQLCAHIQHDIIHPPDCPHTA